MKNWSGIEKKFSFPLSWQLAIFGGEVPLVKREPVHLSRPCAMRFRYQMPTSLGLDTHLWRITGLDVHTLSWGPFPFYIPKYHGILRWKLVLVFVQNSDSAMLSYLYSKISVPSSICILSARQSMLAKSCDLSDPNSKSLKGEAADSLTYFMTF